MTNFPEIFEKKQKLLSRSKRLADKSAPPNVP